MTTHLFPVKYRDHAAALWAERDDHISNHLRAGRFYEAREGELLDVLYGMREKLEGKVFVDVGAHIGNHSVFFAQVLGMHGAAMEPNRENLNLMVKNLDRFIIDMWFVPAASISDLLMTLVPPPSGNSGMASVKPATSEDPYGCAEYSISVDYVAHDLSEPIAIIKIDVEGMEADVLAGAEETIKRDRPIIAIETNDPEGLCPEGYTIIGTKNATPTWVFVPGNRG